MKAMQTLTLAAGIAASMTAPALALSDSGRPVDKAA